MISTNQNIEQKCTPEVAMNLKIYHMQTAAVAEVTRKLYNLI